MNNSHPGIPFVVSHDCEGTDALHTLVVCKVHNSYLFSGFI